MKKRMVGPFEVGDRIGIGGMGIVYRAIYTKNGAPVALKILSPDVSDSESLQRRFEREISILKKLQHPNIVRYYGGGKFGSQRFYAMELVEGGSIESYLKKKKKLPWEEALDIATQVAKALEHAHAAGIIHRDLKPANLLMNSAGVVKLTDFGIARDTTATALTAAGKTVGTYAYMAPEQIRGKPPVDKKTDLYALGCVLFEMISGETPFTSENQGEMLMQHLQEEPPRITSLVPDCPLFLEDLIFKLLEKEPGDRVYDALQLQMEIDDVRTKVTEQRSMTAQALASPSAKNPAANELKGILGKKKKKKKRDTSPFYERVWFLVLCLVALVGLVVWTLQPLSENALLAKAEKLMPTDSKNDYKPDLVEAKEKYLETLLKKYPKGRHVEKAQQMIVEADKRIARLDMHNVKRRRENKLNEAEKKMLEAEELLNFGDRVTARQKYRSIVKLFKDDADFGIYAVLADDEIEAMKKLEGSDEDYVSFLNKRLKEADILLLRKNKRGEAEDIWKSILNLYSNNKEVDAQLKYATARLDDKDPGPPLWDDVPQKSAEPTEEPPQ